MKNRKIIISTDPGGDDTLAIAMALQNSKIEILGITTTFGNVLLSQTIANALRILDYFGRQDIPVIKGSEKPLQGIAITAEEFHGNDGLGDISLPYSKRKAEQKNCIDFYVDQIEKNKNDIDIIALGPLTDIAKLIIMRPDVIEKINNLYIMGGTFKIKTSNNNEEFNFFNDPLAVKIVLNSSIKKYLVPLDVTDSVFLTEKQIQKIKSTNTKGANLLYAITRFWKQKLSQREEFILWDPVGIGPFFKPELYTLQKVSLDISLDPKTKGKLFPRKDKPATTFLAKKVQVKKFLEMFEEMLCQ